MGHVRKVIVVTNEYGKVVGTHRPHSAEIARPVRGGLVAGPGQTLHQIEIEAPEKFESSEHIARFHEQVRQHLLSKGMLQKR